MIKNITKKNILIKEEIDKPNTIYSIKNIKNNNNIINIITPKKI